MNLEELNAIRERCEAATPGPWEVRPWFGIACPTGMMLKDAGLGRNNAAFIAAVRTDVPALLDEVQRLTRERDDWKQDAQAADAEVDRLRAEAKYHDEADALRMLRERERDEARAEVERLTRECTLADPDARFYRRQFAESCIDVEMLTNERDELLVRVANADAELRATRESYNRAVCERDEAKALANAAVIANALCDKQRAEAEAAAEATRRIAREELAAATRERDEARDEREQCRKLYEAECERTKTLERELGNQRRGE